jgi:hypothetical protein
MRLLLLTVSLFLYAVPTVPDICELTAEDCAASIPNGHDLGPVQGAGHGLGCHPDDGLPPLHALGPEAVRQPCAFSDHLPPARAIPDEPFRPPRPTGQPACSA